MRIWIVLWMFFPIVNAFGDSIEVETIETDRPDQTETPSVLPFKYFQFESGFNIESSEGDLEFVHPTILWKVGIFKSTELRVITDVVTLKDSTGKYRTGLSPIEIGFKTAICEERKARPKISFIAHLQVPYLSTKNLRSTYFAPNFRFTLQHTLKEKISLGYNVGMEWDGYSPNPIFIYTLVNGYGVSEHWYLYYEFFGNIPLHETSVHTFDAGVAYLIKKNLQLDLSGGVQLYPFLKGWYGSLGFSFRLPR